MDRLIRLFQDERGATAVEYGIMIAMITALIIGAVALLGQSSNNTFNSMATTIGGLSGS